MYFFKYVFEIIFGVMVYIYKKMKGLFIYPYT